MKVPVATSLYCVANRYHPIRFQNSATTSKMTDNDSKNADALVKKADDTLNKWFYFGGNKWEAAAELYTKAANLYKMTKKWNEAGQTFLKIAQCHFKLDSKHEAAGAYVDAANAFRRSNPQDAQKYLTMAVNIYTEMGRFSTAAKLEKETGELYEKENDLENAVAHYKAAADYYEGENSKSSSIQCLVKVGDLKAKLGKYKEAVDVYEKATNMAIDDRLLTWGARDYLMKAVMCLLADMKNLEENIGDVKDALDRYKDMDMRFPDSRECKLLENLIQAIEDKDLKAFRTALKEYDNISKLDAWKTSVFLVIKNNLEKELKEPTLNLR